MIMWLMTPEGFVSIVEKAEDVSRETLTVRSRDHRSLVAFCALAGLPKSTVKEQIETDYPFRVVMTKNEVEAAVMNAVKQITYSNFKNEAKRVRGGVFVKFLGRVWSEGLELTPPTVQKRVNKKWREYSAREKKLTKNNEWAELDEWLSRKEKENDIPHGSMGVMSMTDDEWREFCEQNDLP